MDPVNHTLMLVQFNASLASRTFLDYASPSAAMDGVCVLYEKELQVLNRLINEQHQPAEVLIRRWLIKRDPNFTAAEVEEHVPLVKRELAQL